MVPVLHRIMVIPDRHESLGEVFEEGTKGDNPKSVMSHEDIPQTNSNFKFISSYCPGQTFRLKGVAQW